MKTAQPDPGRPFLAETVSRIARPFLRDMKFQRGSHRMDSIQGLRALAALLVVVSHQLPLLHLPKGFEFYPGGVGVRMFFVISGFIMVISSCDQFGSQSAPASFMWRRIVRVVPLYWLATAVYATKLAVTGEPPTSADLWRSFLFIPYLDSHNEFRPVYGLGWTLNYEMLFYAIFALALTQPFRRGICAVASAVFGLVVMGSIANKRAVTSELLTFWTDPIMMYFIAGVLAGWLRLYLGSKGYLGRERIVLSFVLAITLVGFYVPAVFYVPALSHCEPLVCLVAFALCAFGVAEDRNHSLAERAIILAGNASYSIYLTHSFVAGPVKRFSISVLHGSYPLSLVFIVLIGSIVVGIISFLYVERPILRMFSAKLVPARAI